MHWPAQQHWKGWKTAKKCNGWNSFMIFSQMRNSLKKAGAHCQSLQSRKWLHEFEYREFTMRCKYLVPLKKQTSEIGCTAVRHGGVSVITWACLTASGTKSLLIIRVLWNVQGSTLCSDSNKWFRYCSPAVRGSFRSPTYSFCPPLVQSSKDTLWLTSLWKSPCWWTRQKQNFVYLFFIDPTKEMGTNMFAASW